MKRYRFYIQSRSRDIDYDIVEVELIDEVCSIKCSEIDLNRWKDPIEGLVGQKYEPRNVVVVQDKKEYYCYYKVDRSKLNRKDIFGRPININLLFKSEKLEEIERISHFIYKNRDDIDDTFPKLVGEPDKDNGLGCVFSVNTKQLVEKFGVLCKDALSGGMDNNESGIEKYKICEDGLINMGDICKKKTSHMTRKESPVLWGMVIFIASMILWMILPNSTETSKEPSMPAGTNGRNSATKKDVNDTNQSIPANTSIADSNRSADGNRTAPKKVVDTNQTNDLNTSIIVDSNRSTDENRTTKKDVNDTNQSIPANASITDSNRSTDENRTTKKDVNDTNQTKYKKDKPKKDKQNEKNRKNN